MRNKYSPIHPNWGRLENVYGAYIQVVRSVQRQNTEKKKEKKQQWLSLKILFQPQYRKKIRNTKKK